jgi:hypothetical protein
MTMQEGDVKMSSPAGDRSAGIAGARAGMAAGASAPLRNIFGIYFVMSAPRREAPYSSPSVLVCLGCSAGVNGEMMRLSQRSSKVLRKA